tara:strand:+ start:1362 stop:2693 length:1332 start_codon:yes stop_codon:yes gene_type:complete
MFDLAEVLTAEQRIEKAYSDIYANKKYISWGGVLIVGDWHISDDCPTAYTNGRDCHYGRAFIDSINDKEVRFAVLHEEYHKLVMDMATWKHLWDIHPVLANISTDQANNLRIISDDNGEGFVKLPNAPDKMMLGDLRLCYDERFKGMDAGEIFYTLLDEDEKRRAEDGEDDTSYGDESGDGGEPSDSNTTGSENTAVGTGDDSGGFDAHDWEGAADMSQSDKDQLAREIEGAISQGALAAGKSGHGDEAMDISGVLEPQVNWRDVMREFFTSSCRGTDYSTFAKPNRRWIARNMYMPSGLSDQVEDIVIAWDTSGSMWSPADQKIILSEVVKLCETVTPNKVHILYWDTEVQTPHETYTFNELDTMRDSVSPKGGGGTDVNCVPDYITKHGLDPQCVIVFTDGELWGDWGTWHWPLLWCFKDNKRARPNVGKHVNIKNPSYYD